METKFVLKDVSLQLERVDEDTFKFSIPNLNTEFEGSVIKVNVKDTVTIGLGSCLVKEMGVEGRDPVCEVVNLV